MPVGDLGDQPNVLNLEGIGTRRFKMHQLGIRADQRFDTRPDRRVVILHLHTKLLQHRVAKAACGKINRIDDQRMIAGAKIGEERHGDRRKARWHENGSERTLQLVDEIA
ncbi:hypothetical protein D3C87_1856640 [compost metagenome]